MEYLENVLTYKDYCHLRESAGWSSHSEAQASVAIQSSRCTVVAVDHKEVVAMGRLIGDGLYDTIVDVVVAPSHQGQGIGSKIVDALLRCAERETPPGGRTSVYLVSVAGKEPFYTAKGFKTLPNKTAGSGMRLVMHTPAEKPSS